MRIRIDDRRRTIGLVFWVQRRKYWTGDRQLGALEVALGFGPWGPVPDPLLVRTHESRWRRRSLRH